LRLKGKRAVVTGGASGIGAATARLFAAEGARVAVLDNDFAGAEAVVAQICESGRDATAWACDVADEIQVRDAVGRAAQHLGGIDTVFNSAGIALRRTVSDTETADWDRIMAGNLRGVYLTAKFCLEHFPAAGGSIIHVSSVTGIFGVRSRAAYSASKGALVALTRTMAIDLAPRNIRVNCVCPGFVRTPLIKALLADPPRVERLLTMHPLGRLGEPEDVAMAALFLASDESKWITGISLPVDGGFSAGKADEV
jgi:NAD(P)-dependent dehydrogenase (short-subunit alcohol dehydrogenase family)